MILNQLVNSVIIPTSSSENMYGNLLHYIRLFLRIYIILLSFQVFYHNFYKFVYVSIGVNEILHVVCHVSCILLELLNFFVCTYWIYWNFLYIFLGKCIEMFMFSDILLKFHMFLNIFHVYADVFHMFVCYLLMICMILIRFFIRM